MVEFGDTGYLQHRVRAEGYWNNAMEKRYIPQNTASAEWRPQEHAVTLKFFPLVMLGGLRVGAVFSLMAEHRPFILEFYSNIQSTSGRLMPPISIPF